MYYLYFFCLHCCKVPTSPDNRGSTVQHIFTGKTYIFNDTTYFLIFNTSAGHVWRFIQVAGKRFSLKQWVLRVLLLAGSEKLFHPVVIFFNL